MVLVDFFGKVYLPDGSHERFMNQLACHIFLLTLSMVNAIYLFFIEGLGKGALKKNFLQQLAFWGALMQMGSCGNSITRYNMEDEYNFVIGNAGAFFGLASTCFNNIAMASILFHNCENRKFKYKVFSIVLIALAIFLMCMELKTYDKTHFHYFRLLNMQNVPFTGICCWYAARSLAKGTVTIPQSILSKEAAISLYKTMAYFLLVAFLSNVFGTTLFVYIGGGLTFGIVNVSTYYFDQMDSVYDKPAGGETASLLPSYR